jgi:hypothetical protein
MNDLDVDRVTRHLEAVLTKERRQAMTYTVATVLCTPAFVVVGALFAALTAVYIEYPADLGTLAFYTVLNAFLAYMVAGTIKNAASSEGVGFDRMWIIGAVLFVVLLILTYATSLPQYQPALFGVTYAIVGFLILGFVSQMLPPDAADPNGDPDGVRVGFALAIPGLITSAYRELLSASWLWFPPTPGEIRIAAMVLCRLAAEPDWPLNADIVEKPIVTLLSRLKLVQVEDQHLRLTPKGLDFVQLAMKE